MGELARFKGELGENVADNFFGKAGWSFWSNIEFDCCQKRKHDRRKHGIDMFCAYVSPLESDVLDTIYVSTKYVDSSSPSKFKEYCEELEKAASCFQFSSEYTGVVRNFTYKRNRSHLVIFWVDNLKQIDYNLSKDIKKHWQGKLTDFEMIHVIDNYRGNFIYSSLVFTKLIYNSDKIEYYYHNTGVSEKITGGRILSSNILPIEYMTSDIILFRNVTKKSLIVCVNEKFEADTFKRIVGLTQNLTSGWCQEIIVAFPDYILSKHKDVKMSVLMSFSDVEFTKMINVKNYNNDFLAMEDKELLKDNSKPYESPQFDIQTMLPVGDQIRQLLNHSYINKNDIQELLKYRGVFVDKNFTKEEMMPFLVKTVVAPSEFEYLKRKQAVKDESEKISTTYLSKDIVEDVAPALKLVLPNVRREMSKKFPNCELVNDIHLESKPDGSVAVKFDVKKNDLSKDWTSIQSNHTAEISFNKKGVNTDSKTQVDSIYSSIETRQMSAILIKEVFGQLKKMNLIPVEEKPVKIYSYDFSRSFRNKFLLSFIEDLPKDVKLQFRQLTSVDFKFNNESEGFPEDFSTLNTRVDESVFTGKDLHEIKYITDVKYRDLLLFYSFIAEYFFAYDVAPDKYEGKVEIEFGFLKEKNHQDDFGDKIEFESKIQKLNIFIDRNMSNREEHTVRLMIRNDFDNIKSKNVQEYINKKSQLALFETNDPRDVVVQN